MPDSFSLDQYFDHAWHMIKGSPRQRVRIEFSDKVAGNVDEVIWHKSQNTWRDDEGRYLFEVDVDGIEEISWWVLSYGDEAVVHEPAELRDLVRDRAERMVRRYKGEYPEN
jgi:predicted DNA-binding transcriptional regulator YafY